MTSNKLVYPFILFIIFVTIPNLAEADGDSAAVQEQYPRFNIVGFLQQQFIDDQTTGQSSQFTIHRARLGVAGRINDRIGFNFVGGALEPPENTPRLVNAFIDVRLHELLNIRTGQFLVPFGIDGPQVIIFNPAIERSTAIRRLNTFRMFRDIGVQLSGRYVAVSYAVAVVNGTGANPTMNTPDNDFIGRIAVEPVHDLQLGVSGHLGYFRTEAGDSRSRNRVGFDFSYDPEAFIVRGEYIIRQDEVLNGSDITRTGGYLLGGVRIDNNWEFIGRIELYDPDTSEDGDRYTGVLLGVNYYVIGQSRISVNYEFRNDDSMPGLGNLLTVQTQIAL